MYISQVERCRTSSKSRFLFFSVLMLQVSLNNGKTFVSSNVNISAKKCTSGAKNRTENGTNTGKETEKEGEQKPEVC